MRRPPATCRPARAPLPAVAQVNGVALTARRHVDLLRVTAAACRLSV